MNKTTLEILSNELFIDLFELLNAVDLFRAFHGLNTRFDDLLLNYFRTYRVDFRSVYKEDFNIFYRTYLPSIKNRIIYLRLSDDEDTPYQCAHFLSHGFTLDQFENLRSLTFNCVSSDPKINQIFFSHLHHLHHLVYLKFVECKLFQVHGSDFQDVINQIWNLPKLTHFYWDVKLKGECNFCIPTVVSTSLQYITILHNHWYSHGYARLFEKTPHLQKFSTALISYEEDDEPPFHQFISSSPNLSITKLNLSQVRSQREMINLFQIVPNVSHLKVQIFCINLNGNQWQQIITDYLPQLKILQFMMDFHFSSESDDQHGEEKVDQYLATYRTPFWIEHHQWFIRCHWTKWINDLSICVYSLPYKFGYFPILNSELNYNTKSTCPNEMHFSYNSVRNLGYEPSLFNNDALSSVKLTNINILSLQLPTDHRFFSIIPNLETLHALNVIIPTINYQSIQLQTLLDSAPHLFSLGFKSWSTSSMPPYQYTSASVRRLDVHGFDQSSRQYYTYDRKQCIELSRSPLGIQCRVLIIEVQDPQSIFELIYSMKNLRTLNVHYEYDEHKNKYDLVKLLQDCLPSTWTVTRLCYGYFIIQS